MSETVLPEGLMFHLKAAVRAQVLACACAGSTGPQRVKELTGFSAGAISRWGHDGYGDLPPLEVVFLLEHAMQAPVFARALAALTGHKLVPLDEGERDASDIDHRDMFAMAASSARLQAGIAEALEDGKITPAERAALKKLKAQHLNEMALFARKLSGLDRVAGEEA